MSETKFKRWFRSQWPGWSETFEPGRGSGVGIPDLMLLVDAYSIYGPRNWMTKDYCGERPHLLPIEMKIGKWIDGKLYAEDVRPDQIGWHYRFSEAGGRSIFLVGTPNSFQSWHCWAINGSNRDMLMAHKQGWGAEWLMKDISITSQGVEKTFT